MRIAITGASGLIGTALTARLTAIGHTPVAVVRREPAEGEIGWDPAAGKLDPTDLSGIDAVVHLAGAGIGDKRWTDEYKQILVQSRTHPTALLSEAIAAIDDGPKVLLSGSAIGIYGSRGDEELDETSELGDGFLADLCRRWEDATGVAEAAGVRVVHLRTGIVMSPDGGSLKKQLPLFKAGLGGKIGSGEEWQSWISIDDEVAAIVHLLTGDTSGPVNLTAPEPVTSGQFTKILGSVLSRPTFMPIPKFGPKLLLGSELAENLLFSGQRVLPRVLLGDEAFEFQQPDLETALRVLLRP
ncbi:MAG: TIGR01777 family oxidoreductase [Ilumatobacteraceae bacterium]